MKKYLLIIATAFFSLMASAQVDCYILGGAHFKPDTAVWSFNSSIPSLLRVAGYFNNQKDSISHKKEDIKIVFEPLFFSADSQKIVLQELGTQPLVFSKIYDYGGSSNLRMFFYPTSSTSMVSLRIIAAKNNWNHPDVVSLFETLTSMTSAEMDAIAGYPLAINANTDSLFVLRKKEFERYYRGDLKAVYAEHLFLLDQQIEFSFSKWEKAQAKDEVKAYSDCEMALSEHIAIPENVAWLNLFSRKSVRFDSGEKDLRKKYHRLPQGRREIFNATEGEGERGEVFISYPEVGDEIQFHTFQAIDNGCVESTFKLKPGIHNTEGLYLENPFFKSQGKLNNQLVDVNPLLNYIEFLFELKRDTIINQKASLTFSDYYLLSADYYSENPISFKQPAMKGVQLFMEAVLSESYTRTYKTAVKEYLNGEVNIIDIPVEFIVKAYHADCDENVPIAQRMYRSPILITDLNKNGLLEYVDVFIQSGGIVHTTIYEKDSLYIQKISMTGDMMKELYQIPLLQGLMILSTQPEAYEEGAVFGAYIQKTPYRSNFEEYDLVEESPMEVQKYGGNEVMGLDPGYGSPQRYPSAYKANEVSVEARYIPGEAELEKFIKKNLVYPEGEKKKQHVTVLVTVSISEKGQISIVNSQSSTGKQDGFTNEAQRVCLLTNLAWYPAEINGKKVPMTRVITVEF